MKIRAPLKRRSALRPVSKRRQREGREYSRLRKEFLALRPVCEAHGMVTGESKIFAASTDIHHMSGRYGGNYLNRDSWLAVCRQCHDYIHRNPKWARENNLLK